MSSDTKRKNCHISPGFEDMNEHSSTVKHMPRVQGVRSVACTVLGVIFKNCFFSWSTATVLVGIVPLSLSLSLSHSIRDLLWENEKKCQLHSTGALGLIQEHCN